MQLAEERAPTCGSHLDFFDSLPLPLLVSLAIRYVEVATLFQLRSAPLGVRELL